MLQFHVVALLAEEIVFGFQREERFVRVVSRRGRGGRRRRRGGSLRVGRYAMRGRRVWRLNCFQVTEHVRATNRGVVDGIASRGRGRRVGVGHVTERRG